MVTYQDYEKVTEMDRVLKGKCHGMKGIQKASNSKKGEEGVISGKSYHKYYSNENEQRGYNDTGRTQRQT
jgi:hypothetical protein